MTWPNRKTQKTAQYNAQNAELQATVEQLKQKESAEKKAYESQRQEYRKTLDSLECVPDGLHQSHAEHGCRDGQDRHEHEGQALSELKATISSIDALLRARATITGGQTLSNAVTAPRPATSGSSSVSVRVDMGGVNIHSGADAKSVAQDVGSQVARAVQLQQQGSQ